MEPTVSIDTTTPAARTGTSSTRQIDRLVANAAQAAAAYESFTQEDVDRIVALVRRVAQGRTVLMVEHNLSVVADICHHVTVLQRGEIIASGDYETVSRDPRVRTAYMGTED